MKTYLIAGGAGFIGSNFVRYLLETYDGIRIVNVDALTYAGSLLNLAGIEHDPRHQFVRGDIRDLTRMATLVESCDPDYIVNFAAESHVDRAILDPMAFVSANVAGTVSLLEAARSAWCRPGAKGMEEGRYLQVGTDEVYGSLPMGDAEALFREDMRLDPRNPYAASKAAADQFVLAYGATYGMPTMVTRCSNNYGPYQFPEKFIPRVMCGLLARSSVPVYGDGMNVRDWLFVEDHCRAIDLVLQRGRVGEVYNVGGRNEFSNVAVVAKIVEQWEAITGDDVSLDGLISFAEDRKGHDRRYGMDAGKIRAELGWAPEVSFEEGLARTIRWYRDHRQWIEARQGMQD